MSASIAIDSINKQRKPYASKDSILQSISAVENVEPQVLSEENIRRYHDQLVAQTRATVHSMDGLTSS